MKITFVKKNKAYGSACRKCAEVETRLKKEGHIDKIDRTVIADERDMNSKGIQLAKQHSVNQAPFFIVENEATETVIYTIYFKFVNEVLNVATSEEEAAKDILDTNDLDFL